MPRTNRARARRALTGVLVTVTAVLMVPLSAGPALAHRDGCHRWHSCPSDSGSYVCGDLGYYSECPAPEPTVDQAELDRQAAADQAAADKAAADQAAAQKAAEDRAAAAQAAADRAAAAQAAADRAAAAQAAADQAAADQAAADQAAADRAAADQADVVPIKPASDDSDSGNPLGGFAVLGAMGGGGWWLLRRRKAGKAA